MVWSGIWWIFPFRDIWRWLNSAMIMIITIAKVALFISNRISSSASCLSIFGTLCYTDNTPASIPMIIFLAKPGSQISNIHPTSNQIDFWGPCAVIRYCECEYFLCFEPFFSPLILFHYIPCFLACLVWSTNPVNFSYRTVKTEVLSSILSSLLLFCSLRSSHFWSHLYSFIWIILVGNWIAQILQVFISMFCTFHHYWLISLSCDTNHNSDMQMNHYSPLIV